MPAPNAREGLDSRLMRRTEPRSAVRTNFGIAFVIQPVARLGGWLLEARR